MFCDYNFIKVEKIWKCEIIQYFLEELFPLVNNKDTFLKKILILKLIKSDRTET